MKSDTFKEFILDQLSGLGEVVCRRMFSGYGLYHRGTFFGIISREQLFFKTDSTTRVEYASRGAGPFRPTPRQTLKTYYEVPPEVIEDHGLLVDWAREAVECRRADEEKAGRTKPIAQKKKKSR